MYFAYFLTTNNGTKCFLTGDTMSGSISTIRTRHRWSCLLLAWSLVATTATAAQTQSHDSIRQAAEQHVLDQFDQKGQQVNATAKRLDSRLRLAACDEDLETFSPYSRKNISRITVGVRCNAANGWTLYVPVTLSLIKEVVIANRELPSDTILTPADITIEKRDVAKLHRGYLERPQQAVGKIVKRRIRQGAILTPGQLNIQHAVKKGTQVVIVARIGTLVVRMNGKALTNGAIGERIKVKNSSSNRQIEATVIDTGVVKATT